MKSNPAMPGGWLKSKPTWSNTSGCSTASAFFGYFSEGVCMGLILLIVLMVLLLGGLPTWSYSRNWGYGPSGVLGLLLVIALVLLLAGYIPRGFS
jgi:hypothetical protein